ncbi:uncharacterized, partial [Tachysurus ichikawai]
EDKPEISQEFKDISRWCWCWCRSPEALHVSSGLSRRADGVEMRLTWRSCTAEQIREVPHRSDQAHPQGD